MLHIVKLVEHRFPGRGRTVAIVLLLACLLALLAGTLLVSVRGGT